MTGQVVSRRRTKGAVREQLIVDAAAAALAEHGLAHVTVSDIADRAGMSPGHVTYYFPSKSTLLMRAIQQSEEGLHQEVTEQVLAISDPWERLFHLIEVSASTGPGDPGWLLWFEAWANAAVDPELAVLQAELDARWRDTLTDVIEYGRAAGAFVTDDPQAVAVLLSSLIDGLSVHVTLGSPQVDVDTLRAVCTRAIEAHLGPRVDRDLHSPTGESEATS